MKKVVVIGAGITGLAAAWNLLETGGFDVTLVEGRSSIGGLASTFHRGDIATDLGPHRLYTELDEARAIFADLLGDKILRVERSSRMLLDGRWIAYPLRFGELLGALGPTTLLRFGASLAAARVGSAFSRKPAASFAESMKRAFGAAAYRKVFEPYARKVWRTDPAELSAEVARVRLPNRGVGRAFGRGGGGPLREFSYIRGGIGKLAEVLAERIISKGGHILLNTRAVALETGADSKVCRVKAESLGRVSPIAADFVISTTPLPVLGEMLGGFDAEVRSATKNLQYLALVLVVLVVGRENVGKDHWLYFPQEPPIATRACEPKNFDSSLAPREKTSLCCEITCRRDEALYRLPDEEAVARVMEDLCSIGLVSKDEIIDGWVVREDWGYPLYAKGFERALEDIWGRLSRVPNLVSTGRQGLFNHNNIDHCLVMGRRAAEEVASSDSPANRWYDTLARFSDFRIVD